MNGLDIFLENKKIRALITRIRKLNKQGELYHMFEKEKTAIIDCPDHMIKISDFYHLLDTALLEGKITSTQFSKWNEVLDNIIPILIKGAKIDKEIAKTAFILTKDMFRNNSFIVYVITRLAGKYEISFE